MKFFGWGRKKDPPPQPLQQVNKSESGNNHGPAGGDLQHGSAGSPPSPTKIRNFYQASNDSAKHRPVFDGDDEGFGAGGGQEQWEDRLQETIRFVFSHEQEGLLAIGTFALDQLAGIRNTLDGHQQKSPDQAGGGDCFVDQADESQYSSAGSASAEEFQSSDDDSSEERCHPSWLPFGGDGGSRKKSELPVFGDHKMANSTADSETDAKSTDDKGSDESDNNITNIPSGVKIVAGHRVPPGAIVLLTAVPPTLKKLDQASNLVQRRTPASPAVSPLIPVDLPPPDHPKEDPISGDDLYYSTGGVCGLFASRRRSSKAQCSARKHNPAPGTRELDSKKVIGKRAGISSLRKLGRLWRSSHGSTAKVAPEKNQCSRGPPCIANRSDCGGDLGSTAAYPLGSHRILLAGGYGHTNDPKYKGPPHDPRKMHGGPAGVACDEYGKWIKTDSEFVVLEM